MVFCLDTLIQTLGMLPDFRKAKNTRLAARVFYAFLKSRNIPRIQTPKTIRYFFSEFISA